MSYFSYKTNENREPKDLPRVYFTCHPADCELHFNKLKDDVLALSDCAVFYTDNMQEPLDEKNIANDLGKMNLFIVPVTKKLLTEPCRAMDVDIAFAKREHIPILPFMMEQGLDALYSAEDKFGTIQYLNPYFGDSTEIPYEKKLKDHLGAILIGADTAKRIRAAFDAYIFLSYRKKDREYANELMRLIHKNPECRDIAIWYDEFLIPGESFSESIQRALNDSALFALLVTPNLLEEPNGKPNFVMGEEYPAAKKKRTSRSSLPRWLLPTTQNWLKNSTRSPTVWTPITRVNLIFSYCSPCAAPQ